MQQVGRARRDERRSSLYRARESRANPQELENPRFMHTDTSPCSQIAQAEYMLEIVPVTVPSLRRGTCPNDKGGNVVQSTLYFCHLDRNIRSDYQGRSTLSAWCRQLGLANQVQSYQQRK